MAISKSSLEIEVEEYLDKSVKRLGGFTVKLEPRGNKGIPDRLVILPGGVVLFIELKRPRNGRVAKLQKWWHNRLRTLGHSAQVASNAGEIDDILCEYAKAGQALPDHEERHG